MPRLVLLGTGTCQLQVERAASSVLIELDDLSLLFDCGRGVTTRLTELGYRQDRIENVLISHFHADHVSDLVPLLHAGSYSQIDPRGRDLHLWGPPGLRRLVEGWLELFGATSLVNPDRYRLEIHELPAGPFTIAGHALEFTSLPPAGNHGLGFEHGGRRYALTGDSEFHDQEIEFLTGRDLAVFDSGHLSDEEIVELAVRTGVPQLVCSHLYRELNADLLNARAAKAGYAGRIVVGRDGMEIEL